MEIAGMFFAGMATAVFFGGLTMFLVAIVREGLAHRRSKSRPRSGPQATPPGLECICNPPLGPVRQPGRLHQWYCPALKEG